MKKLLCIIAFSSISFLACQGECPKTECNCAGEAVAVKADETAAAAPVATAGVIAGETAINAGSEEIALPAPAKSAISLGDSLQKRKSIRTYTDKLISLEQLSALLWAANGINREDGKRTAPSAMNKQSVTIFAAFEQGTYKYDHANHKLVRVAEGDLRPVKAAPLELIMTSKHESELIRGIDAGTVSQNVALFCAAENLATVIRMMRGDHTELQKSLGIEANNMPLFNMAIGFEGE